MSLSLIFVICDNLRWSLFARLTMLMMMILTVALLQGTLALKLTSMSVPSHPVVGDLVILKCEYDMEGAEVYSVKWYKGGAEFYRYLPKDRPPAQVYQVQGANVDIQQSNNTLVTLKKVNLASSGIYRCEISAEAPFFTTVTRESEMVVIDLPEGGPKISGGRAKYQVGDTVQVNCTSYRSKPAAMLSWSVNGGKANKSYLREFSPHVDGDGLETSILGLEFQVDEKHFQQGEMKLKCTAAIAPIYHQSNEESVIGGNQQASVLESKVTPGQGQNSGCLTSNWTTESALLLLLLILLIR